MSHSLFSPSAAHRWVNCPGSMAYPQESDSSDFADDGTASHEFAAMLLKTGRNAEDEIDASVCVGGKTYTLDEERAFHVQMYLDDVRRRMLGGVLLVEQWVRIAAFGDGQGGTGDAVIIQPAQKLLVVEDLKYGTGEKVYARDNEQGLSYLLGALPDAELYAEVERFQFVVCQPRLNHIDEWEVTRAELEAFAERARRAVVLAGEAMALPPGSPQLERYLNPGDKTCRWCRAKATCPKLAATVAKAVRADFEDVLSEPRPPVGTLELERAWRVLPLVKQWGKAVEAEVWKRVAAGEAVNGVDGKPMKIVEGDEGRRQWRDAKEAEETLMLHLPPEKLYKPREIITAPQAGKLLDKKATKQLWTELSGVLIERKRGMPQLANGSDPRPPYTGAAGASEFTDEIGVEP